MNCCICGTAKNCGKYLNKVIDNMHSIGQLFDTYEIIIYVDSSVDNTIEVLKSKSNESNKIKMYVNSNPMSAYRTHNLAIARNFCLNYVLNNKNVYNYFIMMDCDDVNSKDINLHVLRNFVFERNNEWDGLTFNTSPSYYDIWALSLYPYCFSYNHFNENVKNYNLIQYYVQKRLNQNKKNNSLLQCMSAFNGFAIYKTEKYQHSYYDGRIRLDLISKSELNAHKKISNSNLVFKKYITVDGRYEDCEHRAFHIQALKKNGARLMISPDILFY